MSISTGPDSGNPLITADTLGRELAGTGSAPVVLDVRWTLAGADENAYRTAHIPGALFVDLDAELAGAPGEGGRHPLPEAQDLARLWAELGLADHTPVVVYDARDASIAARLWWLLRWSGHRRVRVLDGGLAGWITAGGSVEAGVKARPGGGSMVVEPGAMPTVDIDEAAALGGDAERVLLDARAGARFRGEVEPIDPVAGHIPGATSLPLTDLVTADGHFLPVAALDARFRAAGVGADTVAAASCGSGVTACHLILAAEVTDRHLALYPGSFSGWCAAGRPVATGP